MASSNRSSGVATISFCQTICALVSLLLGSGQKLSPSEFFQPVLRSLFPAERESDQLLFQLCVVSGQETAAFSMTTATALTFGCRDFLLLVHPNIKTRHTILFRLIALAVMGQ